MQLKQSFSKPILIIGGFIIAVIIFLPSFYFFQKYERLKKTLTGSPGVDKSQVEKLVSKVGKLIELPAGEEPTIATVSDKEKLPPQAFFEKAQNGDQVLIYTKAKKAYLYRPSTNKIIDVGPVTVDEKTSPTPSPKVSISGQKDSEGATPTPFLLRVAIYNASKTAGLAASTEARLKTKFNNISVVEKGNSLEDYDANLVVDLSGQQKSAASQFADFLGGEVGALPPDEIKPASDILVIVVE